MYDAESRYTVLVAIKSALPDWARAMNVSNFQVIGSSDTPCRILIGPASPQPKSLPRILRGRFVLSVLRIDYDS